MFWRRVVEGWRRKNYVPGNRSSLRCTHIIYIHIILYVRESSDEGREQNFSAEMYANDVIKPLYTNIYIILRPHNVQFILTRCITPERCKIYVSSTAKTFMYWPGTADEFILTHTHIHTYTYIYINRYIHIYIHTYIVHNTYIHTYTLYIYIQIYTMVCVCVV